MGDRAFKHVGERQYVEGVPFGEWVDPGDMYISEQPLWPDDIELVAPPTRDQVADAILMGAGWTGPKRIGADPNDIEIEGSLLVSLDWVMSLLGEKHEPAYWCRLLHIAVKDPDGWRGAHQLDWEQPITRADFLERAKLSTVQLGKYFLGWDELDGTSSPVQ